ncbi:MAG: erythromycin esterase family protein [Haloarculaceae archaeon]
MTPSLRRGEPNTERVEAAVDAVAEHARPLSGATLARLAERFADRQFVCIGEASHGTSEFYRLRARLTKRLLAEYDFSFVAVEGDWTDCHELNRFVKGVGGYDDAQSVLSAFDRWPTWLWANWEVLEFVDWLADCNEGRDEDEQFGFYGMDVYSLFESMAAVIDYLEDVDPDAAEQARRAYQCFEPYGEDGQTYARETRLVPEGCEDAVVQVLRDRQRDRDHDDHHHSDAHFDAEQNALVAKNAEQYYRTLVRGGADSWNVRDGHMTETLRRLCDHHDGGKGVVWAHNTHVGDARATDMVDRGEATVGQLLREDFGADDVALVGLGTNRGSVIAGRQWGATMEEMAVPTARRGSYENVFSRGTTGDSLVYAEDVAETALADARGNRAIGVVYHPEREWGNYVPTVLPDRYDAFCFFDETEALHPLHSQPAGHLPPEMYPWGV